MLNPTTPLWFLDETFTYFILQRPLEGITESEIQLDVVDQHLCLTVPKLDIEESFRLPKSIDLRGMNWGLKDDMLTVTLEKAPMGRAIRVSLKDDGMGKFYGEYKFDHMFPPNNPPEAFFDEESESEK